jgi:tetrahydromethanopterin S-methyltransferase subunit C
MLFCLLVVLVVAIRLSVTHFVICSRLILHEFDDCVEPVVEQERAVEAVLSVFQIRL